MLTTSTNDAHRIKVAIVDEPSFRVIGELNPQVAKDVAVIEAARLEALAEPGEILATELVARLGSRRARATFERRFTAAPFVEALGRVYAEVLGSQA